MFEFDKPCPRCGEVTKTLLTWENAYQITCDCCGFKIAESKQPNKETLETFAKTGRGEDIHRFDSIEDFERAVEIW